MRRAGQQLGVELGSWRLLKDRRRPSRVGRWIDRYLLSVTRCEINDGLRQWESCVVEVAC